MVPIHVADAMDALNARNVEAHDRLVAGAAGGVRDVDAIALAQFSMARALRAAQAATVLPILTTPASAVRALRQRLAARNA